MGFIQPESNFFGRETILELLKKRYLGLKEGYRQNIALVGSRFLGKTTVLHKFLADLDDEDIIKIYIDLDNHDFQYFSSKFVGNILYDYAKSNNLPLYNDLKILTESLKKKLPKTTAEIEQIENDKKNGKLIEAYRKLIHLPETFSNETKRFCVLVFDEFHNLEEFGIANVFQELGNKIMTQKKSLYIVTSSYPEIAHTILNEKLSLLFGNFETVRVNAFDVKTSQDFIQTNLDPLKMGAILKNFLIDFTGGHPLYLKLIIKELHNLSAAHEQTNIFSPLLVRAIENTVFDQWGVLSRHFELLVNALCSTKGNRIVASILITIANHKFNAKDLAKHLGAKQSLVTQKVKLLVENGTVEKNGNSLFLKDKLFRYWIKYAFQKRLKMIELDPIQLKREFKDEVNRSIDGFKLSTRRDFSTRIVDLFTCFDNESLKINGRKYKLPSFVDFQTVKMKSPNKKSFDVIRAKAPEGVWLVVFKKGVFHENEVHALIKETKSLKEKPQRCIMITLSELDESARIKALQERVWIWNENEINTLLGLYDKPYIV